MPELSVSLDDSMDGCGTSYRISVTARVSLQRYSEPPEIALIQIVVLVYQLTLPINILMLLATRNKCGCILGVHPAMT